MNHAMAASLARTAVERVALSALPDAPVLLVDPPTSTAGRPLGRTRQAIAGVLRGLAERTTPNAMPTSHDLVRQR